MGYAGLDALGADATRALPVFRHAGWGEVRYADSGRVPDTSWQRHIGWHPAAQTSARPVTDWYDRYGRFPDDVPGSGY